MDHLHIHHYFFSNIKKISLEIRTVLGSNIHVLYCSTKGDDYLGGGRLRYSTISHRCHINEIEML